MNHTYPTLTEFAKELPEGLSVGHPTAEFTFSPKRKATWALLGFSCVVGGMLLLGFRWFAPEHFPGPTNKTNAGMIAFLAVTCGGLLFFNAVRKRRLHAWTGTEGVALLENDTIEAVRWLDIVTIWDCKITGENSYGQGPVWRAAVRGEQHVVIADCRNGKRIVFKSFLDDISGLADIFKRETLEYLLRAPSTELDAKLQVQFGPVAISTDGIARKDGKVLSWRDVNKVVVEKGSFCVSKQGKWLWWFSCKQGDIPNLHVLMALVNKYRR